MKKWMLIFAFREYGAIDDVDIDLHIDVSFLDVSMKWRDVIATLNNLYFGSWKKFKFCFSYNKYY